MSGYRKTRNAVIYPKGGGAPWRPIRKVTYKDTHELKKQLVTICRTHFPPPMAIVVEIHSRTVFVDGTARVQYELVEPAPAKQPAVGMF
ncbi:hypothetical protein AAFM46_10875 [Arthrobacter sp. TMP15]|uniref:hypothetical protein n=1 Tax=Arthrobacter sp. TMP15 TaxID=3140789 RepID=UPI0031BA9C75